jgi:ElaB/YqjD/DUF883 family membrane-anchored ribosome-binding protein
MSTNTSNTPNNRNAPTGGATTPHQLPTSITTERATPQDNAMSNPIKDFGDSAAALSHQAAQNAEDALRSTQQAAQQGLNSIANSYDDAKHKASTAMHHLTHDAQAMLHHGLDAASERARSMSDKSVQARDATANYVQHEPVKAMLIAAAAGAALMGLVALFSRNGGADR